ncbi:MAG: D-alanyl-D-alanine carboxypeptidase/D-alanyl-D-alanine-endopeptidase, partial [Leptolyngbyaceae cyanobacterium SL_7_1]|nr:D-alanyl-D-alanine carboxypeptidase/D-alanyl-D-alanine-endopeptidase [Leptolyngbyaceae cyanobacterium SL_7_1]
MQFAYAAPASQLIVNQNQLTLTLHPQAVGQPLRVQWQSAPTPNWQIENTSLTVAAETSEALPLRVGRDLSQPMLYVSGQLPVDTEAVEESDRHP